MLLQREIPEEINTFAAKVAKEAGIPVLLDVGGQDIPLTNELLENVSILSPNETELQRIIESHIDVHDIQSIIKVCDQIRHKSNNSKLEFLIKLGSKGAIFINVNNEHFEQNCFKIPSMPILDTTGAGDCFTGSFSGNYLASNFTNIAESLKFATGSAYKSITRFGAGSSMPNRSEVEEVLKIVSEQQQHH